MKEKTRYGKRQGQHYQRDAQGLWQIRLTGCVWLLAYCAIHCSFVRPPPSIAGLYLMLLFGSQQKDTCWSRVDMAVKSYFLVCLLALGFFRPKATIWRFVIDRESASKHHIGRQARDCVIRIQPSRSGWSKEKPWCRARCWFHPRPAPNCSRQKLRYKYRQQS